jgi:hypothetical protein
MLTQRSRYMLGSAAALLLLCGYFPVMSWWFEGSTNGQLVFQLHRLDWFIEGSNIPASSQENQALAWLTYGIAALGIGAVFSQKHPELQQKLIRAITLLSGAQLFSLVVTSFRAPQGVELDLVKTQPGPTLMLSILSFLLLAWVYRGSRQRLGE